MARVQSSGSVGMPVIYNTDKPVGFGKANIRDDVLLAQYLLKIAYDGRKQLPERPIWMNFTATNLMLLDGIYGKITEEYLTEYIHSIADIRSSLQLREFKYGLDPARSFMDNKLGMPPIMVWLNLDFKRVRPGDFPQIALARDLPQELYRSLLCIS